MAYETIPFADLAPTREAAVKQWDDVRDIGNREGAEAARRYAALLGRSDLFLLAGCLLNMPWHLSNDWLFARAREVQESPNGHLDLWARGHGKSNLITMALTIQDILNDPEITVAIFSHTRKIATDILGKIKRELEGNATLKYIFSDILWQNPKREAPRWSEDGLIVRRKLNPRECTIEAHGLVDSMPTGMHFSHRVYDDVVDPGSVTTNEQIQKTTDAWDMSQNLGIAGAGIVRYIGTRYNLSDTYSVMLDRGAVKPRIYPATHNGRMDGRPVFLSEDAWANLLRTSSSQTVASQQLQNPMADEAASFRTEWLKTFSVRPRALRVYIACDPSAGRSAKSDNTAIAVIGVGSNGVWYFLGGCCHRMALTARWQNLSALYHRWSNTRGVEHVEVGYERYGLQSDLEHFEREMEFEAKKGVLNARFPIQELNWARSGGQSKRERVERLEPLFRMGEFLLPLVVKRDGRDSWWIATNDGEIKFFPTTGRTKQQIAAARGGSEDLIQKALTVKDPGLIGPKSTGGTYDLTLKLIDEYKSFPFGRFDDLLDACSRVVDMDPRGPIPPSKRYGSPPNEYVDGI